VSPVLRKGQGSENPGVAGGKDSRFFQIRIGGDEIVGHQPQHAQIKVWPGKFVVELDGSLKFLSSTRILLFKVSQSQRVVG
jgi:hypothetical protein